MEIAPDIVNHIVALANRLEEHLTNLDAPVTAKAALLVKSALTVRHSKPCTWREFGIVVKHLDLSLVTELQHKSALVLDAHEQSYFAPAAPLFGTEFADKFRADGAFELDEAAKCKALGRPTAAVFHLMRLMEIGIRAFAKCLVIPDPIKPAERNWGVILKSIWGGIEAKWPTAAARMHWESTTFHVTCAN